MSGKLHVFAGNFASRNEACLSTEAQWEPEPDEFIDEKEFAAWEDRNPTWYLSDDLGDVYLDPDFIETIDGDDRYKYLSTNLPPTNCVTAWALAMTHAPTHST